MRKARCFWPILATLVLADCSTKELVETALIGNPGPHPVVGDWLRVTLAYNPGAAFSTLSLGNASRPILGLIAVVAVIILLRQYRKTRPDAGLRASAIALMAGGALGNLLDRVRSPRGVVDFIDLGIGDARFYTFNVADMGITVGAILLALVLWRDQDQDRATEAA